MSSGKQASTDDTAHRESFFKTIIRKGGRIDAWDLGQGILDFVRLSAMAATEIALYQKLVNGCPAHDNGHGLFPTPTCGQGTRGRSEPEGKQLARPAVAWARARAKQGGVRRTCLSMGPRERRSRCDPVRPRKH